jgi:hypothetical protein
VLARRPSIRDDDAAIGVAPEHQRLLAQRHATPVGQHERAHAQPLMDLGRDVALAGAQLVVGDERDRDRTDEVVALGLRVLPCGLRELTSERVGE